MAGISGDPVHLEARTKALMSQVDYLFRASQLLPSDEWSQAVMPLVLSICSTCKAIALLGEHGYVSDLVILSRALLERLVNLSYLTVCDDKEFQRFRLYPLHKAYRKGDREFGGLRVFYSGKVDVAGTPELEEALRLFTSSTGKEHTSWTSLSLEKRLEVIGQRSRINPGYFAVFYLTVFEDASEALHGSLYGAQFELGTLVLGSPQAQNVEELFERERRLQALIYKMATHLVAMTTGRLASKYTETQNLQKISFVSWTEWEFSEEALESR